MANQHLTKEIHTIHYEVNGIYGYRHIKDELKAMGHEYGRHRIARLMRDAGLRASSRKRCCIRILAANTAPNYQGLLRRHRIVPSHSRRELLGQPRAGESFSFKGERAYLTRYPATRRRKPTYSTTSAFTITAVATRLFGYLSSIGFEWRYASSNS